MGSGLENFTRFGLSGKLVLKSSTSKAFLFLEGILNTLGTSVLYVHFGEGLVSKP